jgi:hypothetical protein
MMENVMWSKFFSWPLIDIAWTSEHYGWLVVILIIGPPIVMLLAATIYNLFRKV